MSTNESEFKKNEDSSKQPKEIVEEIETYHKRIVKLRETNATIEKEYLEDKECKEAFDENAITIDNFILEMKYWFGIYKRVCNGVAHPLEESYAVDINHVLKKRLNKDSNIQTQQIDTIVVDEGVFL
ncbi:hypothetical protein RFI_10007 [Reticulomyxa filosa]|uniref:Uncharacterized protein n=1 Tax=Reticulomyxa filosa TaxID=46433 RepID=X6NLG2_RETFI|nr:hypothetical protein RFI_10007 [Reticulomyxa filosa]|eukprot:ETO27125.1 hypothetical protein RFI_10007 [Reticulomyxa filosa]